MVPWGRLALLLALLGAFAGMGWRIYSLEATLAEERQARAEDNARAERERAHEHGVLRPRRRPRS